MIHRPQQKQASAATIPPLHVCPGSGTFPPIDLYCQMVRLQERLHTLCTTAPATMIGLSTWRRFCVAFGTLSDCRSVLTETVDNVTSL